MNQTNLGLNSEIPHDSLWHFSKILDPRGLQFPDLTVEDDRDYPRIAEELKWANPNRTEPSAWHAEQKLGLYLSQFSARG